MRRWISVLVLCVLSGVSSLQAAGAVTVAPRKQCGPTGQENLFDCYRATWTSDGSGVVSGIPMPTIAAGFLLDIGFEPGTGGAQPSDNYDVSLTDCKGRDLLGGQGQNLDQTDSSRLLFDPPPLYNGAVCAVTLTIGGAGSAKSGVVTFTVQRSR